MYSHSPQVYEWGSEFACVCVCVCVCCMYHKAYTQTYTYAHRRENIHRYVSTEIYMYKDKITVTQTEPMNCHGWSKGMKQDGNNCRILECYKDVTVLIPESIFMIRITPRVECSHMT